MDFVSGVFNWLRKIFAGNSRNRAETPYHSSRDPSTINMAHNINCNLNFLNNRHSNCGPEGSLLENPVFESYYDDTHKHPNVYRSIPASSVNDRNVAAARDELDYYKNLGENLQERIHSADKRRLRNEDMEPKVNWILARGKKINKLKNIAVVAGHECDGTPLWVIRTRHLSNLLPAKLNAKSKIAYVAWNDKELVVNNAYEVLCIEKGNVIWQEASDGWVPHKAVPAGKTKDGEKLYVGRVTHSCALVPGKVQPSRRSCYITYQGNVFASSRYEVMCVV